MRLWCWYLQEAEVISPRLLKHIKCQGYRNQLYLRNGADKICIWKHRKAGTCSNFCVLEQLVNAEARASPVKDRTWQMSPHGQGVPPLVFSWPSLLIVKNRSRCETWYTLIKREISWYVIGLWSCPAFLSEFWFIQVYPNNTGLSFLLLSVCHSL